MRDYESTVTISGRLRPQPVRGKTISVVLVDLRPSPKIVDEANRLAPWQTSVMPVTVAHRSRRPYPAGGAEATAHEI
jgi:hypothetical protein